MDSVNSHSSLEQVEEYSEESSLDGKPCAQWNVMPTQQGFWRNDKMMAFSRLSQFGVTLQLLTASRGEELLTSFLAAFPVKTSALQEAEKASAESEADCGKNLNGLLAKYDPDTHSLKTAQRSLLEDSIPSSPILPKSGSMQNGCVYQRPNAELRTSATEYGYSVPTPTAQEGGYNKSSPHGKKRPSLTTMARKNLWPTPKANDAKKGGNFDTGNPRNGLPAAAKKYPTPTARDSSPEGLEAGKKRNTPKLTTVVQIEDGSGQLNPTWVELLMGWPKGWTDLDNLKSEEFDAWVKGFSRQNLPCVQEELQSAKNAERKNAGCKAVFKTKVLQPNLRKLTQKNQTEKLFVAGEKAQKECVRGLRFSEEASCSPLRPGSHKQQPGEPTDAMQPLPRLLARYGEEAWQNGSWEDAVPRTVSGMNFRVDRLRAIGNGQVSRVAATAFELLQSRIENLNL